MLIKYTPAAKDDLDFWITTGNKTIIKKIVQLLNAIKENPFIGIGKPEPLKYELSGKWSRRITKEHRLVYSLQENILFIYSLRGHYKL